MNVSIVVPTFARDTSLSRTVASLAATEARGIDGLEIIVVDDGSPVPVAAVVELVHRTTPAVRMRVIRQANSGPAAARNRGFREASGDLVIFVDDDIEAPPGLVSEHAAAHRLKPGSVVFGRCVLDDRVGDPLLHRLMDRLGGDAGGGSTAEFEASRIVASGQLSVPRHLFVARGGVYCDELRTPAAEEYELSLRLMRLQVPAWRANRITAIHRTELSLERVSRGQYSHGWGCAEAAVKAPETLDLPELRGIIDAADARIHLPKRAAGSKAGRHLLGRIARAVTRASPRSPGALVLYRWVIGAHFTAGVRDGLRHYRLSAPGGRASRNLEPE